MDLYGDLPPALGESGEVTAPLIGEGWTTSRKAQIAATAAAAAAATASSSAASGSVASAPTTETNPVPVEAKATTKPFVLKPTSALAFRPRQTLAPPQLPKPAPKPIAISAAPAASSHIVGGLVAVPLVETVPSHSASNNNSNNMESSHSTADSDIQPMQIDSFESSPYGQRNINSSSGNSATFDVSNPYNPAKPNDYLSYCEERAERERLAKLEQENRKQLLEAERQRAERDKARTEAVLSGDLTKIQSALSGGAVGRGRGRGSINNLPAWMTQGAVSTAITGSTSNSTNASMFQDADD